MDNLLVMILLVLEVGWAGFVIYILLKFWKRYKLMWMMEAERHEG